MERKPEPTVNFEIEIRSTSMLQKEAGKRLFKRLVARVKSSTQTSNEPKNINKKT
jgi:hypothetical protein